MKYRNKIALVEAIQYTGKNIDDVVAFWPDVRVATTSAGEVVLLAPFLLSFHVVGPSQWIIKTQTQSRIPYETSVYLHYDIIPDSEFRECYIECPDDSTWIEATSEFLVSQALLTEFPELQSTPSDQIIRMAREGLVEKMKSRTGKA